MPIERTPMVDDDGSGHTGTIINDAWKTEFYNQIDDAITEAGADDATLPIDLATDVVGTLPAASEPAHTGDVTNAAGSLALAIGTGKVTNAMIAGLIPASKLVQTDLSIATVQLTGILAGAQEPAHTGDVTNSAGSLNLTIGAGKVTSAMLAPTAFAPIPAVVTLTDGATVTLDAASRASFYLLRTNGNRVLNQPLNPTDGQKIIIVHQALGAARTLTLAPGGGGSGCFRFSTDIPALTPTPQDYTDFIGAIYSLFFGVWHVVAYTKGFVP